MLDDREQHPGPTAVLGVLLDVARHGLLQHLARVVEVLLLVEVRAEGEEGARVFGVARERLLPRHHPAARPGAPPRACAGTSPGPWKPLSAEELPSLGGEEDDRGERRHLVLERDVQLLARALGVHLDRDEVLRLAHDPGVGVGRAVEPVAPAAPVGPEVHDQRLAGLPRLLERLVEVLLPLDRGRRGRGRRPRGPPRPGAARARGRSSRGPRPRRGATRPGVGVEERAGRSRAGSRTTRGATGRPPRSARSGISRPSTTPSSGQRAETTSPSPRRSTRLVVEAVHGKPIPARGSRGGGRTASPSTWCARRQRGPVRRASPPPSTRDGMSWTRFPRWQRLTPDGPDR